MRCRPSMLPWFMLAALALPASAVPACYPIDKGTVAEAMQVAGVQIKPDQVLLLSDVLASTSTPKLRVRSMQKWGDHRMMVRLECGNPAECHPFLVGLDLSENEEAAQTALAEHAWQSARPPLKSYVARAGSSATLLLDGDHVHIRLPVICLENGVPGQKIRVAGRDRKQVYTAEVVDSMLLKGRL